jgi:protein-disulfide isomerase
MHAHQFFLSLLIAAGISSAVAAPASAQQTTGEEAFADARNAMIAQLAEDPAARRIEPDSYDLTLVVFTDYQCPFCRQMHPRLTDLAAEDGNVRIVFKDWAIFGEPSVNAARGVLAAKYQGKDRAFDDALMQIQGKLSSEKIRSAADKAGVDWQQLQSDMKTHGEEIDAAIARSDRQAGMLGIGGTPAMFIGPYFVSGALPTEQLRQAVAIARQYPDGDAPQAN